MPQLIVITITFKSFVWEGEKCLSALCLFALVSVPGTRYRWWAEVRAEAGCRNVRAMPPSRTITRGLSRCYLIKISLPYNGVPMQFAAGGLYANWQKSVEFQKQNSGCGSLVGFRFKTTDGRSEWRPAIPVLHAGHLRWAGEYKWALAFLCQVLWASWASSWDVCSVSGGLMPCPSDASYFPLYFHTFFHERCLTYSPPAVETFCNHETFF